MVQETTTSTIAPSQNKPTTRSSIRHSLNLASVGKAFADVMNKESRDANKNAKKAKDSSSRRLSAVNSKPATPRASMGDSKPPSSKRADTPESKTVTRRRVSGTIQRTSSDEQSSKSTDPPTPQAAGITRGSSSLRPKNPNTASSLPKYRPKSALVDAQKFPPSPARLGTRRRSSTSEDEKEDEKEQKETASSVEKRFRPISPLPHRAALKTNLSNVVNLSPTTPTKSKLATPSGSRLSPSRPSKTVKTTATSVASSNRPPSSTSSSSSFTPRTPKAPAAKSGMNPRPSTSDGKQNQRSTPSKLSPADSARVSPSPLARHIRNGSKTNSPTRMDVGNMSHISEGNSEESDEEDVILLLAPSADLSAPTPAMPRILASRSRKAPIPQTPTRNPNSLPTRANMSYLSPLPPDSDKSSPSLRPSPQRHLGSGERAARGSILSWEQLASDASRTLGEDELGYLLSDIPAPFRSGAVSPSPSTHIDVPESPCLSALDSPGAFGSISQVLLPDVTPSPAVNNNASRYDLLSNGSTSDSATSTLLRLQLAAAENTAKERLYQLQAMEEELHNLKEVHSRQMQESAKQLAYMEVQERESTDNREAYTASLEDQLRHLEAFHNQNMQKAIAQSRAAASKLQRHACAVESFGRMASFEWGSVREMSELELDCIRGDQQTLSVMLQELDQMYQFLS